jgi:hypothetical protein
MNRERVNAESLGANRTSPPTHERPVSAVGSLRCRMKPWGNGMSETDTEVQMQRPHRPYEIWKGTFEEKGPEPVIRCGVCLKGTIEPVVGLSWTQCGTVIKRIMETL